MERFTFVRHKLTGQRLFVIETGVIVVRQEIAGTDPSIRMFETLEVNEREVEEIDQE